MKMKKVVIYVCLTAFFFGTMEVALKVAGNSLDAIQMTFLRFLIGGLVLAPFGWSDLKKRGAKLTRGDLLWLFAVGVMGVSISMLAFQFGVSYCNAATASSIICLNPLFTMLIAHLFTTEKMDRAKWMACGIGLIAAVFMIRPWDVQPGNTPLGLGLTLLASVTFGAYTVMGKRTIGRLGALAQTSISFLFGSLLLLIALLVTGRPVFAGIADNWLLVAYIGIVVTGVGYIFYFTAIRYSDATTGAIAFYIKPAIAPILAVIFLGEHIYWNTVVGVVLLIGASILILRDAWGSKRLNLEEVHSIDEIFAQHHTHAADKRRFFSCMLPLIEVDGEDHLVLEVRNQGIIHQRGEICFPGGEMYDDEAPGACAMREVCEELGVRRDAVHVINQMDTYHGLQGMKVYSFICRLDPVPFDPDPRAVDEVLTIPVSFFLNTIPEMHHLDVFQRQRAGDSLDEAIAATLTEGNRDVPVYRYGERAIWGLTAMLLLDFSTILRDALKK